ELVVGEPSTGLEHSDPVALLGQPQRRDAAAESRSDHEYVVVHRRLVASHRGSPSVLDRHPADLAVRNLTITPGTGYPYTAVSPVTPGSGVGVSPARSGPPAGRPSDPSSRTWPSSGAGRRPGCVRRRARPTVPTAPSTAPDGPRSP